MDISDFSFQSFSNILNNARKTSDRYDYKCCIPECNENTLKHSHIVPQCVLKKYVCNAKHELIQCQLDEVHPMSAVSTGELPFEKFATLGIEKAMSMPIFCKEHDNGLFDEYERNADGIMPEDPRFQILQSLRAIGALRHREERKLVQKNVLAKKDEFYTGGIFEEEKKCYEYLLRRYDANIVSLYDAVCKNNFSSFEFICLELDHLDLAICDAFIDEDDVVKHCCDDNYTDPLKVLYIHLLPKGNHSYLMLGFDKRYLSDAQKALLKKWSEVLKCKTDIRTIYNILCHCSNNWCISPECDDKIVDGLKSYYSINRMETILGQ